MKFSIPSGIVFIILAAAFLMPLSGCAGFHARSSNVSAHIDRLVEKDAYDKALAVIAGIPADHPDHDELVKRGLEIESTRQEKINLYISAASAYEDTGEWAKALAVIDEALGRFSNAPDLEAMRKKYDGLRQDNIRESRNAILLARGRYLADIRPHKEALLQSNPGSPAVQRRYRKYKRKLENMSSELYLFGVQSMEENKFQLAFEALTLSDHIHPNEKSRILVSKIHHKLDNSAELREEPVVIAKKVSAVPEQKAGGQSAEKPDTERLWQELEETFGFVMQLNDYTSARTLIMAMVDIDPERAEHHKDLLNNEIDRRIKALQARGTMLYGQGMIEEALKVWQEALELKPDYLELLQNINRARTFLENLDRWKDPM